MGPVTLIIIVVAVIAFGLLNAFVPFGLWIAARAAGVEVRIFGDLVAQHRHCMNGSPLLLTRG